MGELSNLTGLTLILMARHNQQAFRRARKDGDEHAEEMCVRVLACIMAELARREVVSLAKREVEQAGEQD